ncbi:MAG: phosphoribosylformylglycinamidine synthase subunit PurS [Calditrichaeota bacterium]|nr:phosphoribosylformylglycinamidine synthase subunit PurS [Calditrichota bacterium]
MKVRVVVRLKPAILDPQGKTVQMALEQMGYGAVKDVRIGKLIELEVENGSPETVQAQAEEFSRKLLANPLMETYEIQLIET